MLAADGLKNKSKSVRQEKKEEETEPKINGIFTSDKMDVRCKTADTNAHPMRNMNVKHEKDRIQIHSCARTVQLCGTSLGA